jgi:hypothetical protein
VIVIDYMVPRAACKGGKGPHLDWLIRKVEVIRGKVPFKLE